MPTGLSADVARFDGLVTVSISGRLGDFDGDQTVGRADVVAMMRSFGTEVERFVAGGLNGDRIVSLRDLSLQQLGVIGGLASASVPEPSSMLLALIGGLGMIIRRRRVRTDDVCG